MATFVTINETRDQSDRCALEQAERSWTNRSGRMKEQDRRRA